MTDLGAMATAGDTTVLYGDSVTGSTRSYTSGWSSGHTSAGSVDRTRLALMRLMLMQQSAGSLFGL